MKKQLKIFLILGFIFFTNQIFAQKSENFVKGELIVKFKDNKGIASFEKPSLIQLRNLFDVYEYKLTGNRKLNNTFIIRFNEINIPISTVVSHYKNTGKFECVELNYIVKDDGVLFTPDDPNFYNEQWSLYNDGTFDSFGVSSTEDADIDVELAWNIEQGDSSLIIAIIDGGVKLDHPELEGRIWINEDEVLDGTDSDGNGYVDDINGWNFFETNNSVLDDNGHGTGVTGVVGATGDNGIGVAGVNWFSKLMICKTGSPASEKIEAIYYAIDNGAKIISISSSSTSFSSIYEEAVDYAYDNGVCIVCSMGNQGTDVVKYPAAYTNTIAVGATDYNDQRANPFPWSDDSGSNYGDHIDVVAPGVHLRGLKHDADDTNFYWSGTSVSTPIVTGIVSLLLSQNPTLTPDQIRTIITETADDQVGDITEDTVGWDQYYGHGRVNAFDALNHNLVGISEYFNFNQSIKMYPNPILQNNRLTITNVNFNNSNIIILNTLGQEVFSLSEKVNESRINVSIPKLVNGVYNIKIIDNDTNEFISKKIIIK